MKGIVKTENAPAAIGPYSQATINGQTIYVSGQLPIDHETGELCKGSVREQTLIAMRNLKQIVEAAGSSMDNVLKTTALLTDLGSFDEFNSAHGEFFADSPPARACYQVAALPKGASVEIEAICAV